MTDTSVMTVSQSCDLSCYFTHSTRSMCKSRVWSEAARVMGVAATLHHSGLIVSHPSSVAAAEADVHFHAFPRVTACIEPRPRRAESY